MTTAARYLVRRRTVELDGSVTVRFLVRWNANGERTYASSCWTSEASEATRFDLEGARFAASMVGGRVHAPAHSSCDRSEGSNG